MATLRAQIVANAYSSLDVEYPNKVFVGRRLPVDLSEVYGISVDWSQDQTDYSAGMMASTPQHQLTLVVSVTARAVNPAQPVTTILDGYSAGIEEKLYLDQTFGGVATGMEISSIAIELDEETQSTAGTLTMEFLVFYYAQEGAPQTVIN